MLRREVGQNHAHALNKLTNGHPGAAMALLDLLRCGRSVGVPVSDDAAWCLHELEALGISGVALCVLWGDVCGCDAGRMVQVLRACANGSEDAARETILSAMACQGQVTDRYVIRA